LDPDLLVALDAAVYLAAALGAVAMRTRRGRASGAGSFGELGEALRVRFPELPEGFTMREGLARARREEPGLDWDGIDRALVAYEGQRYGGLPLPPQEAEAPPLGELVRALRRRARR